MSKKISEDEDYMFLAPNMQHQQVEKRKQNKNKKKRKSSPHTKSSVSRPISSTNILPTPSSFSKPMHMAQTAATPRSMRHEPPHQSEYGFYARMAESVPTDYPCSNERTIIDHKGSGTTRPMERSLEPPKQKIKYNEPNNQILPSHVQTQTNFRHMNLPLAPFYVDSNHEQDITSHTLQPNQSHTNECTTKSTDKELQYPLPQSSPEGLKWKAACIATQSHPRYSHSFDFERYQHLDIEHGRTTVQWTKAQTYGDWCENNPQSIAIDCEMCETRDPVTGVSDGKALCRVSVINAANPEDILLDTLVKPTWPIVDDRSRIHGITKDTLEKVQFTIQHAQEFLLALCSEQTVVIGHAVHNDLVALKFAHHCIVDSSLLFTLQNEPNAACSLKDLAMSILTRNMPDTHDSVNDSRVSLQCLEKGYLAVNGEPEHIVRSYPSKHDGYMEQKTRLLVHRIPQNCNAKNILSMFLMHTHIQPKDVQDIEFNNSNTGRTYVGFLTEDHVNLAFHTLSGEETPDATGKLQKRVYLKNGGYVNVRKMVKN